MEHLSITQQKDYSFTPENLNKRFGEYITSVDRLPSVDAEKLSGKTVLITGGTRGIGKASALEFAKYNMNVVVNGRSEVSGQEVVDEIQKIGSNGLFVSGDVSDPNISEKIVGQAIDAFGRLDILINNVGTKKDDLIIRMTPDEWHYVLNNNLDSAFYMTKAGVRSMLKNKDPKGGMIVYVSSVGQEGFVGQSAYAASKRGIEALADVAAQEYVSKGIKTSVLRLGLTKTDLTSDLTDTQKKSLLDILPSHRQFSPSEVALTMPFLSTFDESGHILTLA